jgi:hypothetical protein
MVKKTQPPASPEPSVCIGALSIDYPGRFEESDISSSEIRTPLNAACRALDGIAAIAKVLYSNEIERHAQGEQAVTLDSTTAYGLFEAISFLIAHGNINATNLGVALSLQTKGGA